MVSIPEEEILELQHPGTRAICITLVADADSAAVYEAFGGRFSDARPLTQHDCEDLRESLPDRVPVPLVRIGTVVTPAAAGGVFVIEDSSAEGARPTVLREASRGTEAVAVSLAPGDLPRLTWYREGRLAAAMIANSPDRANGPYTAELDRVLSCVPGLRDRLTGVKRSASLPAAVQLAATLTGLSLESGWTGRSLRGGVVLPVLDDVPAQAESVGAPTSLRLRASGLIEAASDSAAAAAVPLQAQRLASDADLYRWPEAATLVDLLGSPSATAAADTKARQAQDPDDSAVLREDSPISLLIRRLSSPLHWHTVIDPSTDPEPPLRVVIEALGALRAAVAAMAAMAEDRPDSQSVRSALRGLVFSRPTRLGLDAAADLASDLGVPPPRRQPAVRDEAERDRTRQRQEALAAVRERAGRLPVDGVWADPGWLAPVPGLQRGQSLILAADLSPDELLGRVADGRPVRTANLLEATGNGSIEPVTTVRIGIGRTGSWALAVEQGSSFILRPELLARIGAGTRLLCLQHDGVLQLSYVEDGVLVDRFQPLFPERRDGADPGRLDPYLAAAGRIDEVNAANAAQAAAVPFRVAETLVGTPFTQTRPMSSEASADSERADSTRLSSFLVTVVSPLQPHGADDPPAAIEPITTPGGLTWWPRPGDPGRPERHKLTPQPAMSRPGAISAGHATTANPSGLRAPRR